MGNQAPGLVDFFVRMLADEGDLVLDPFAGSNTTGAVAEHLGRRWIATKPIEDYVLGYRGRFPELVAEESRGATRSERAEAARS